MRKAISGKSRVGLEARRSPAPRGSRFVKRQSEAIRTGNQEAMNDTHLLLEEAAPALASSRGNQEAINDTHLLLEEAAPALAHQAQVLAARDGARAVPVHPPV
jgi:hypothetical protein